MGRKWAETREFAGLRRNCHADSGSSSGKSGLKDVEMRNRVLRDLDELHQELDLAVGRLRQKSQLARSFFAQVGLRLQGTRSSLRSGR
jgi:hypothetical protein